MTKSSKPTNGFSLRKIIAEQFKEQKDKMEIYLLGIYHNRLLYYAKITDVLEMASYYGNRMSIGRYDDIYNCDENSLVGLKRNENYPHVHPKTDTKRIELDIAGKWVLLSDTFTYWGKNAREIKDPDILGILPQKQEHKPSKKDNNDNTRAMHLRIHEYVMSQTDKTFRYKLAEPNDDFSISTCKVCHQK